MTFACFFLAEYSNMILMSILTVILFFGGWNIPFLVTENFFLPVFFICFKTCVFIFIFVWVRAAFPRLRYDQLMFLGWKIFLPLSLSLFFVFFAILYITLN
jgi:NADH-quinone oxidoreductase subunit H